jgi:tRNA dimethylallyltransferase
MLGLRRDKESTNKLINARIKEMFAHWLIDEVQWLLDMWYTLEHTAMNGIWYKEIIGYLQGEYDKDKAIELLKRNTHRYAKRQRCWFRKYIAEGKQTPKDNVVYRVFEL